MLLLAVVSSLSRVSGYLLNNFPRNPLKHVTYRPIRSTWNNRDNERS